MNWPFMIAVAVPLILGFMRGIAPFLIMRQYPGQATQQFHNARFGSLCISSPSMAFASIGFALAAIAQMIVGGAPGAGLVAFIPLLFMAFLYSRAEELSVQAAEAGDPAGRPLLQASLLWALGAVLVGWVVLIARWVLVAP